VSEILEIMNQGVNTDNVMLLAALATGYASKMLHEKYAKKKAEIKSEQPVAPDIAATLSRIEEKIDGLQEQKPKLLTDSTTVPMPKRGRPKKG
jgi:hypothetical protein